MFMAKREVLIAVPAKGMTVPLTTQDMAQLSRIQGFIPDIIDITPAVNVPIISELQQKLQSSAV